jgi:peptide/nickel transport system substrate-binding protein
MKPKRSAFFFKPLLMICLILFLVASSVQPGYARNAQAPGVGSTFVELTTGIVDTLDPALAYDTASGHILYQVYEGLLFYNREKADEFIPMLATGWTISPDGLTYIFNIRDGVQFHNGNTLTPSDVAYSLQRGILQGGSYSPQYLFTEAFFGTGINDVSLLVDDSGALIDDRAALQAADAADLLTACNAVTDAIVADDVAGTVTLNLAQAWAPMLGTLAGSWGGIMDEEWTTTNGGWDGDCGTWQNYYAMTSGTDPFTGIENGTGPFYLSEWTGNDITLQRNASYWRPVFDPLWFGAPGGPAFFNQVLIQYVDDETARYNALVDGSADLVSGVGTHYTDLDGLTLFSYTDPAGLEPSLLNASGILNRYIANYPMSFDAFFVYQMSTGGTRNYIGSGVLDGNGIPVNFFNDLHVRKMFSYAFNYDQFLTEAYGGNAIRRRGPIPSDVTGYSSTSTIYPYNPAQAVIELGQAWGGLLTTYGFSMTLSYNTGNLARQKFAEIMKASLESLDPAKIHVTVTPLSSADYSSDQYSGYMPIFTGGWLADIPHPHNWALPYMGNGFYSLRQRMPQSMRDVYQVLISNCLAQQGAAAETCYQGIQSTAINDAIDIFLAQPTTRTYLSASVRGFYMNPYESGPYYYALSRGSLPTVQSYTPSFGRDMDFDTAGGLTDTIHLWTGALDGDYDVAITSNTRATHAAIGFRLVAPGFAIQAFDAGDLVNDPVTTPVTLNLAYGDADIAGMVEDNLTLYYWTGIAWEDASCGTVVRNTAANTIQVNICHFSSFTLGSEVSTTFLPLLKK